MRIRDDIIGVVIVHTAEGSQFLKAGDTVPAGVNIDADLVDGKPPRRRGSKPRGGE